MVQKCLYLSTILDNENFGSLMIHFETKTWNEHPIASKAYKKVQIRFSMNFCKKKQ